MRETMSTFKCECLVLLVKIDLYRTYPYMILIAQ